VPKIIKKIWLMSVA